METTSERQIGSFLVRLWFEPREVENGTSPLRGYVRHLQTGEELYFSDPQMIADYMLRQLQDQDITPEPLAADQPCE